MMKRKQLIKLYWLWKLKTLSVIRVAEESGLNPYKLGLLFDNLDKEFEMEGWRPNMKKYYITYEEPTSTS